MCKKLWLPVISLMCISLLSFGLLVFIPPSEAEASDLEAYNIEQLLFTREIIGENDNLILPASAVSPATTLIVTSGEDPDTHNSYTLKTNPDGKQTLRRAVIQALNSPKPVEIRFNIPTTCPSYDSESKIWKIQFDGLSTDPATLRYLNGQIWIDGTTQPAAPDGRALLPRIILVGANPLHDGIKLGATSSQNTNIIRGLGFQNFKDHVTINSESNVVEQCWFGLNDTGTLPYLRNDSPAQGSGVSGVTLSASAKHNLIRTNVFLGLNGTASTLRGWDNTFENNYVGTRWDGTVVDSGCTPDNWLGGGGVTVQGRRQMIQDNIIAGLRFDQFDISQPPDALKVSVDDIAGAGHTIRWNLIGRDANDTVVGSCGRGVYLSNRMRGTLIEGNIIDSTNLPGMSLNGLLYNQCEFKENQIWRTSIEYGPAIPDDFKDFKPPKVISIEGTTVKGTSGDGSPSPNVRVELFLDVTKEPAEAREWLATVQADENGNWSTTIPYELTGNQGIRTTLTTTQFGTIPKMLAGTTTKLSEILYRPAELDLSPVLPPALPPKESMRLSGADRYQTAIAISKDSYPEAKSAGAVVIARGDQFADALPGGVLAYKENGPLLLTSSKELIASVETEIKRVLKDDGTIYILGGTAAVSSAVESKLKNMAGYKIERIAGENRTETAYKIAQKVGDGSGKAIIAYSHNFPDALAISSYAARKGIPILTSGSAALSADAQKFLNGYNVDKVYVVGGTSAISGQAYSQIEAIVNDVERLGGANRYETARLIANKFFPAPTTAALAFGRNFPDALSGAVNAAKYDAPILLAEKDSIPPEIQQYLTSKKGSLEAIIVYGGVGVISNKVMNEAEALIQ